MNGATIYQVAEMLMEGFRYYHIDTGQNELLVANGVRAESNIDHAGIDGFVNGEERIAETVMIEMAFPHVSSTRHVPLSLRNRLMVFKQKGKSA